MLAASQVALYKLRRSRSRWSRLRHLHPELGPQFVHVKNPLHIWPICPLFLDETDVVFMYCMSVQRVEKESYWCLGLAGAWAWQRACAAHLESVRFQVGYIARRCADRQSHVLSFRSLV